MHNTVFRALLPDVFKKWIFIVISRKKLFQTNFLTPLSYSIVQLHFMNTGYDHSVRISCICQQYYGYVSKYNDSDQGSSLFFVSRRLCALFW